MSRFAMCPKCRAEYDDPGDRRFHAQPTACRICGPCLAVVDHHGRPLVSEDPLSVVVDALRQGGIVAMKGLGGYHLVCDAQDQMAVRELRKRKQREAKPLAVMVPDAAAVGRSAWSMTSSWSCSAPLHDLSYCCEDESPHRSPLRWRPTLACWASCFPTPRCITYSWSRSAVH